MMQVRSVVAGFAAVAVVIAGSIAFGQGRSPAQADFDECNRQAQAKIGASASPASPGGASGSGAQSVAGAATSPGSTGPMGTPGTAVSGTPGTASAGTTGAGIGVATPGPPGPSTGSDVALRGMASAGQGDTTYQQAYRDCMRQRGF